MDISSWMVDTISVASPTGAADQYGQPVFAAARSVDCRLERINKLFVEADGNERYARHRIACDQELTWEDVFWLPGEDTATVASKRPLSVTQASTKYGAYTEWEVML